MVEVDPDGRFIRVEADFVKAVGDPRFHTLLAELGLLHAKKAADYGRDDDVFANVRASQEFGVEPWRGALIRLNDKVVRLKTFCVKGSLANEGVEDSLMDLAAYALIALILFREEKGNGKIPAEHPALSWPGVKQSEQED